MVKITFSKKLGIIDSKSVQRIISLMKELGLNIYIDRNINVDNLVNFMMRDKKSSSTGINLVLINGIARPYSKKGVPFYRTTPDFVRAFLGEFIETNDYLIEDCANYIKKEELDY